MSDDSGKKWIKEEDGSITLLIGENPTSEKVPLDNYDELRQIALDGGIITEAMSADEEYEAMSRLIEKALCNLVEKEDNDKC